MVQRTRRAALALIATLLAGACQGPPDVRVYPPQAYPQRLSEWGLLARRGDALVLGNRVQPYDINTPLFSDYALKLRTYYLPPGTAMDYRPEESFDFPVGSVISKTFFYPVRDGAVLATPGWDGDVGGLDLDTHRLVETRLLVRQADGWDALPYVWQGDDAFLRLTGAVEPLQIVLAGETVPLPYVVPARSECAGCHATDHTDGSLRLIGLKARHLNRAYPGSPGNQLALWSAHGELDGLPAPQQIPRNAAWDDASASIADRARAYLDSNCGHCHNPAGAADTSGLLLDAHTTSFRQLGFCKPPVAAGRGSGGRPYSIVPGEPERSILIYRTETSDPATRMPETGRSLSHREGVDLLRQWVAGLPGECV